MISMLIKIFKFCTILLGNLFIRSFLSKMQKVESRKINFDDIQQNHQNFSSLIDGTKLKVLIYMDLAIMQTNHTLTEV